MSAKRPYTTLLLLFIIVLLSLSNLVQGYNHLRPQECRPRCTYRCSATSHKKPCMFFCLKCCAKCLCVPPGTYGNKQTCACYNNWKTKEGGPKCP
ncbi:protein RSI-1 [Sesamum indicum]|uniref:Protein RSI-1 n=1 Tax=Sesamum indicum TaxID=4182 RepID=A0A6I9UF52_SESIN|nr:protein RSI-1 [Sesamum indicum]